VRRNSKRPLPRLCTTFRRDRVNVAAHLVSELASAREPPAERLDEPIIALPPLGLSGGQCGVWQWRRARQPKAHEHRQRLVGNADVPFDPMGLAELREDPEKYLALDFSALMETMGLVAGMTMKSENVAVPSGLEI
jgi:hypothetical protein